MPEWYEKYRAAPLLNTQPWVLDGIAAPDAATAEFWIHKSLVASRAENEAQSFMQNNQELFTKSKGSGPSQNQSMGGG